MEIIAHEPDDPAARLIAHEQSLVRSAIDMVVSGAAVRVSVGGLTLGEQLRDWAALVAEAAGVRVTPVWTSDDAGVGFIVEARLHG